TGHIRDIAKPALMTHKRHRRDRNPAVQRSLAVTEVCYPVVKGRRGVGAMKLPRRRFLQLAAGAAALPAVSRFAWAQAYTTRPITMVVPYGAGGSGDTIGRIVAEGMRGSLGQPVIVENVVGASGTIGVGRVARASPDGYTFVLGNWATHVLNGPMFALQYDLIKEFEPIS